ncbi:MAG: hypothetical protein J6M92_14850 [Oribacterium sp.]|nr:hypothetical protein [Oribacterium sp.]
MSNYFSLNLAAAATQMHHVQNLQKAAFMNLSRALKEENVDAAENILENMEDLSDPYLDLGTNFDYRA